MDLRTKLYIAAAAAALVILVAAVSSVRVNHTERRLEQAIAKARWDAEKAETAARESEIRAAEYKQKTEYLEASLAALRGLAMEQDEEIKKLENTAAAARRSLGLARAVRSVHSTNDELCAKLAALGHPCE